MLYPNPSKGEFTLRILTPATVNSTIKITILNTISQVILSEEIKSNEINYSEPFIYKNYKLTNLLRGIYLVNVRTDNYIKTGKLIIVD